MTGGLKDGELLDGKYRIARLIGRGGWATVYEAMNVRLKRRVAIKIIHREMVDDENVVQRFLREARAATSIESDHVVHVYDLGVQQDGRPYIVMEMLDGEDLAAQLARRGRLSPRRAVSYAVQALRGLAAAHAAGVLHRDIKPGNIIAVKTKNGDDLVKIVDFGISKLEEREASTMTQTDTVLGSPIYMSPEQCRGIRTMDHRSDIYSMGVVLFEALTGSTPHQGKTFNQIMFKVALEDAASPLSIDPDLDPDLCAIVHKALAREPDDRYQTAVELEDALVVWGKEHGVELERRISDRVPLVHDDDLTTTLTEHSKRVVEAIGTASVDSATKRSAEPVLASSERTLGEDLAVGGVPAPPATSSPVTSSADPTQTGDLTVSSSRAPNRFEEEEEDGATTGRSRWTRFAVAIMVGASAAILLVAVGARTRHAPTTAASPAPPSAMSAAPTPTMPSSVEPEIAKPSDTANGAGARASSVDRTAATAGRPSTSATATDPRRGSGGGTAPTTPSVVPSSSPPAIATPAADGGGLVDGRHIRTDW